MSDRRVCRNCGRDEPTNIFDPHCAAATDRTAFVYCEFVEKTELRWKLTRWQELDPVALDGIAEAHGWRSWHDVVIDADAAAGKFRDAAKALISYVQQHETRTRATRLGGRT